MNAPPGCFVGKAIYTLDEVKRLAGTGRDDLRAIHEIKRAMDATIVDDYPGNRSVSWCSHCGAAYADGAHHCRQMEEAEYAR